MAKANAGKDNRRHFSRIHFDAVVNLRNPIGHWTSKLIDVSLKGVLVSRPHHWTVQTGDAVKIEIRPPDEPFSIKMECKVAHVHPEKIGLECLHIDIDSISHLRRIVELNIGDEKLLNRELSALIHI